MVDGNEKKVSWGRSAYKDSRISSKELVSTEEALVKVEALAAVLQSALHKPFEKKGNDQQWVSSRRVSSEYGLSRGLIVRLLTHPMLPSKQVGHIVYWRKEDMVLFSRNTARL
jgi:hypothetical protein